MAKDVLHIWLGTPCFYSFLGCEGADVVDPCFPCSVRNELVEKGSFRPPWLSTVWFQQDASVTWRDLFRPKSAQKQPEIAASHDVLQPWKGALLAPRSVIFLAKYAARAQRAFHIGWRMLVAHEFLLIGGINCHQVSTHSWSVGLAAMFLWEPTKESHPESYGCPLLHSLEAAKSHSYRSKHSESNLPSGPKF